MSSILCLAHYCDTHGPTPLMVTEESPVPCSTCYEERTSSPRPQSTLPDTPLPSTSVSRNTSFDQQPQQTAAQSRLDTGIYTPNTPPASPRMLTLAPPKHHSRRDSSFRKTYDDADKKRAIPCENCALTLPKQVSAQQSAASSPQNKEAEGPVLKTRQPYAVIRSSNSSPVSGSERSDSEGDVCEADAKAQPSSQGTSTKSRRKSLRRSITGSAASSTTSLNSDTIQHKHYIEYTSAHDPLTSESYKIVRQACLRTLSMETLPPPPRASLSPSPSTAGAVSSPTSPFHSKTPSFQSSISSTFSQASATINFSGGPLMFGDKHAGYTTAFIFRIPDPCARGRRRQYAFICLSRTGEMKAVRTFKVLSQVFADLAAWIQNLAEGEADRLDQENSPPYNIAGGGSGYCAGLRDARANSVSGSNGEPRSSFISGRGGSGFQDGGGLNGGIRGVRSRGLAELVGQPDFFLQLHVRFVEILARLRYQMDGN